MVRLLSRAELICREGAEAGLKLDPDLTIDLWADRYRVLTSKAGAEPGLWRTSRAPYLREIMVCLSPSHPCERVIFMKAAQVGGTEVLLNWLGFVIDLAPGPFMLVQSTLDTAEKFSKQRLAGAIEESPRLRVKVSPARERDSGNTTLVKEFPGGILNVVGGNSEDSLRSVPMRYLGLDEVDMYPGYTVTKAEERTETFVRRKIFLLSCPKKKENSIIADEYKQSDQRKFFVPCPFCKKEQILTWEGITYKHEKYELITPVTYTCEFCERQIEEHQKAWMVERGRWIAQNPEGGQFPGFHLAQFYSLLGAAKWRGSVKKYLKFKKQEHDGITTYIDLEEAWTNDVKAEPWEPQEGEKLDWQVIHERREVISLEPIPRGIVYICAGVDVQKDRLEVQVVGFGRHHETWILEVVKFHGDPSRPEVWETMDNFLLKTYNHPCGKMKISSVGVDLGGLHTSMVYEFTGPRKDRLIFAIKGASTYGCPIIGNPSINKKGVYIFLVGTDTVKTQISNGLKVDTPGPSYVHFPMALTKKYFQQLCAESLQSKWKQGVKMYVWKNVKRARNEALDTLVYSIAALSIIQVWVFPDLTVNQMIDQAYEEMNPVEDPEELATTPALQRPRGRMISRGVDLSNLYGRR